MKLDFDFTGELWEWQSPKASWYFVSLPVEESL